MRCPYVVAMSVAAVCLGVAGSAYAVPFTVGDVFASVGNGLVKEFTPTGVLVQTLNTTTNSSETTGSAFDSSGNFYVTDWTVSKLSKFDNSGNLLNASYVAGNNPTNNESIVFDGAGNFYLSGAGGNILRKFDSGGALLNTWTVAVGPRGVDWIDLGADQKTIYYTSEGGAVKRFDTATATQLPDLTSSLGGVSYALRILADGTILVAHTNNVLHLDALGNITNTYTFAGGNSLFALNLDPDGTTFWTGNIDSVGTVFHVRISDGAILGQFNTVSPGGNDLAGLSIFGEITQGCPTCGGGGGTALPEPGAPIVIFAVLGLVSLVRTYARKLQWGSNTAVS